MSNRALSRVSFGAALLALCLSSYLVRAQDNGDAPAPAAPRLALVIGQSDYRDARLITGTEDASRISSALAGAGFSVDGAADVEQLLIREKVRDLIATAQKGPEPEAIFVYLGGRVAQINGENFLLPVGAPIERASDVLLSGFRLADLVGALKLIPAKARIIVIDAAAPPERFAEDKNFSPGLAIMPAPDDFLIAYNQNPGRPLLEPQPPMGLFLRAFLDALQKPAANFGDVFALARQRVFEESQNHALPWEDDKLSNRTLAFFPPAPGVTLPTIALGGDAKMVLASLSRDEAYKSVIAADKISDYQNFLVQFPNDDAVQTIQYNLAVRREAEVWSRALLAGTPEGYWTYISTYPDGGNVEVARQRLRALGAGAAPPPAFAPVAFADLPPPIATELVASSASMPIEYMPAAPRLNLAPIAPMVAAVAATPIAAAVAGRLPAVRGGFTRPSWAASPVRAAPVSNPGSSATRPVNGAPAAPAVRGPSAVFGAAQGGAIGRPASIKPPSGFTPLNGPAPAPRIAAPTQPAQAPAGSGVPPGGFRSLPAPSANQPSVSPANARPVSGPAGFQPVSAVTAPAGRPARITPGAAQSGFRPNAPIVAPPTPRISPPAKAGGITPNMPRIGGGTPMQAINRQQSMGQVARPMPQQRVQQPQQRSAPQRRCAPGQRC